MGGTWGFCVHAGVLFGGNDLFTDFTVKEGDFLVLFQVLISIRKLINDYLCSPLRLLYLLEMTLSGLFKFGPKLRSGLFVD